MKWGRRKAELSAGPSTPAIKPENDPNHKTKGSKGIAAPSGKKLTDAELRRRIKRLQMEKQYKDLTHVDYSPAKKLVGDLLSAALTSAVQGAANTAGSQAASMFFGGQTFGKDPKTKAAKALVAPLLMKAITRG